MTTAAGAQDLSDVLHGIRSADGVAEADKLARDMIASAFAYIRIHKGARECVRIADQLAQDFCNDVLGQPRKAK